MWITSLPFNLLVEGKSRIPEAWPGRGSWFRSPCSCYHLLLRTGNWKGCVRRQRAHLSLPFPPSAWFFLIPPDELRSIPWLLRVASVLYHAEYCNGEHWPNVITWSFSVIWFPQKTWDLYCPHWDMFPWWTERFFFGFQSISILKSQWQAVSIHSTPPTEQRLKYMENYLYLCCRCRNSWNLMEHSVPLTGFQNSIRRTSNHLSYSLGLLEVKQSLANLCFIFDLQSPHHNTREHWEWNFLLPSQIVFWIDCVLDNFMLPAEITSDTASGQERDLDFSGWKTKLYPYPSCYPTVCVKTLVTNGRFCVRPSLKLLILIPLV